MQQAEQAEALEAALARAKERRSNWETIWRDCYAYALPIRATGFGGEFRPAASYAERVFDGTAADGVEQLAASLLAELAPPWSGWFGFKPGADVPEEERVAFGGELETLARRVQGHFDRSNFAIEVHQCLLDLVTAGTATLLVEEAPPGEPSALKFSAVPLNEVYLDGEGDEEIKRQFRVTSVRRETLLSRFSSACGCFEGGEGDAFELVESLCNTGPGTRYAAYARDPRDGKTALLSEGLFETSPFLTFRWMKGTGEVYGRSPMMTALPDVRTANKVVELILKNASIAVTGIWMAEDDGVLNPANIRLTPGSIIPKAAGSSGLTPLQAPGRFDVSQLVLDDLRARIRHTLLIDRLAPVGAGRMTATEVLERSIEATRLLSAVYGRLQAELLNPLLRRAVAILARRGEIPPLQLDGRVVDLQCRSPLARLQAREDARNTMMWLESAGKLGTKAEQVVDGPATVRWLAEMLGVPGSLLRDPEAEAAAANAAEGDRP